MKVLQNTLIETDIIHCSQCDSKLEINIRDLYETDVSLFATAYAVKCPVCGKELIYNGTKFNKAIFNKVVNIPYYSKDIKFNYEEESSI